MLKQLSKWLKSKSSGQQEFETPHGLFTRWNTGGAWSVTISYRDKEVFFQTTDFEGQPNPKFIDQFPNILRQLPSLESSARQAIPQITARHELDGVDDLEPDSDFSLVFYYEENEEIDSDSDAVTVYFKNGQIVKWMREDFNEGHDEDILVGDSSSRDVEPSNEVANSSPWGTASSNDDSNDSPWS